MLDSDGNTYADIALRSTVSPARMTVYKNDGGCSFTPVDNPMGVAHVLALTPVRLDVDVKPDFMALDASRTRISWWKNEFEHSPQPENATLVYEAGTLEPTYT